MTDMAIFPVYTVTTEVFNAGDITVTVADGSLLPAGPNEVCIGAEEPLYISYDRIEGNVIYGVTRNIGSYAGAVPAGAHVASYLDMRAELDEIASSDLPNSERLGLIASTLGWNNRMDAWVSSTPQLDPATGESTGYRNGFLPDGSIILYSADDQALYAKKRERYDTSFRNNRRIQW